MSNPSVTTDLKLNPSPLKAGLKSMTGYIKQWASRAKNAVGSVFKGIGALIKKAMIAGLGAAIGVGVFAFVTAQAASAAEEIENKYRVVFKNLQKEADAFVSVLSSNLGAGAGDIQKSMSELGDILKPLGASEQSALDLSGALTQLAYDLASFNNEDPAENVERLKQVMTGSHEVAKRWGVSINDATLKLELQRLGLAKSVQTASEYQKALARMSILFKSTSDAQGDMARTQDSYANTLRRFKSTWTEMLEEIGKLTMPVVKGFIAIGAAIAKVAKDATANASLGGVQEFVQGIADWLMFIADVIGKITFDDFKNSATAVGQALWDSLALVMEKLYNLMMEIFKRVASKFADYIAENLQMIMPNVAGALGIKPRNIIYESLRFSVRDFATEVNEGLTAITKRLAEQTGEGLDLSGVLTPEERAAQRKAEEGGKTVEDEAKKEAERQNRKAFFDRWISFGKEFGKATVNALSEERKEAKPVIAGVAETYNRVMMDAMSGADDAQKKTADNTKKTVEALTMLNTVLFPGLTTVVKNLDLKTGLT